MRWLGILLVAVHAAILLGHDAAHRDLGVGLVIWQQVYAYSLIVAGPLLAVALLLLGRERVGFALLAGCMFAALIFGGYHHYVAISPDHVSHLPEGPSQPLFRATAALLAAVELAGAGVGWRGFRDAR